MLQMCLLCGLYVCPSVVSGPTIVGVLVGGAGSWPSWLPRACWWAGQVSHDNGLEGGFQNGACQCPCQHCTMTSQRWLLPESHGSLSCLLPLWEALQCQPVVLTQALLKLLPQHWDLDCVRFCGCPLCMSFKHRGSLSYRTLALLNVSSAGFQSLTF